jgi:hypothetical protein
MGTKPVLTGLIVSLLLALCVTQVLLFVRLQKLEDKSTEASPPEVAPAAPEATAAGEPEPVPPCSQPRAAGPPPVSSLEDVIPEEPKPAPEQKKAIEGGESPEPPSDPSAPVTEGRVKDIVKRMLEEDRKKRGPGDWMRMDDLEDPLEVMKRELNLTPAQILAIKEHRAQFEATVAGLMTSDGMMTDQEAWTQDLKAASEEYHASVKRELNYEQQQKYDTLRESGKLVDFYSVETEDGEGGKTRKMTVIGGGGKRMEQEKKKEE